MSRSAGCGVLLAVLLAACAGDPVERSERLAATGGASRSVLRGTVFEHVVFSRGVAPAASTLHVYVGGDGRAFLSRYRVAPDPTPQRPLTLQLMLADPAPAAYVARPCYHGAGDAEECGPELWTSARYAPQVIDSMAAVVQGLAARVPEAEVTLIGYSGGGVVATLTAARLDRVSRVVTLAAPLDLAAWTRAHGYTPLARSLDPAMLTEWPTRLRQVHVHGERDRNVAPAMVVQFQAALEAAGVDATFRVMEGFDHVCCWLESWPGLLEAAGAGHWPRSRAKL